MTDWKMKNIIYMQAYGAIDWLTDSVKGQCMFYDWDSLA